MSKLPRLGPPGSGSGPLIRGGWDTAIIGGIALPGRCDITKGGKKMQVDVKKAAGKSGGNPTTHGIPPEEFDVEVTVWTDEQVDWLTSICADLLPAPGTTPKILTFDHPATRILKVTSVIVIGSTALQSSPLGPRARKMTIHLREKMAPKKGETKTAKGTASIPNKRREDTQRRNPLPSQQPSTTAPPRT